MDWDKAVGGLLLTAIAREIGTRRMITGYSMPLDFIAIPMWLIGMFLMASAIFSKKKEEKRELTQ